MLGKPTDRETG